jgi:hypothetical protein
MIGPWWAGPTLGLGSQGRPLAGYRFAADERGEGNKTARRRFGLS